MIKLSLQIKDSPMLFFFFNQVAVFERHQQSDVLSLIFFFLLWLAFELLLIKVLATQLPFLGKQHTFFPMNLLLCICGCNQTYGGSKLDVSFTLFSIQSIHSALKTC